MKYTKKQIEEKLEEADTRDAEYRIARVLEAIAYMMFNDRYK